MDKRWPLHPEPKENQLLYAWVQELADLYEISYQNFCKKVLKLTKDEIYHFRNSAPEKALIILSSGTGIPIDDLKGRDIESRFKKWEKEYNAKIEVEVLQRSYL